MLPSNEKTDLKDGEVKGKTHKKNARKYGKPGILFDIQEFQKNLDLCNFKKFTFGLEKNDGWYYIIVMAYDPDTLVGVVKTKTRVNRSQDVAISTLEEIILNYSMGLPPRPKHKRFFP